MGLCYLTFKVEDKPVPIAAPLRLLSLRSVVCLATVLAAR